MTIPAKILISRIEDYHTHFAGKYGGGNQFLSSVVATLPAVFPRDWEHHKRWYAVLHTFDAEGNHLCTDAQFAGTTSDGEGQVCGRAEAWQDTMLADLEQREWSNIAIRLFSVSVDGSFFGLVNTSFRSKEGIFYEEVSLLPNDCIFEPWDGDYDT